VTGLEFCVTAATVATRCSLDGAPVAVEIAIVSGDAGERLAIARAFDAAPASWHISAHASAPPDADVVVLGRDAETAGGIRFDGDDPGATLQAVREAVKRDARCIVVTSAGGGTGVTTLVLHLARALTAYGTCAVIELDATAGVADRVGIDVASARTWGDRSPDEDLMLCALPVAGGFRVLLAPHDRQEVDATNLIRATAERFDRVLIDAPAEALQHATIGSADVVVFVVPPALPGARRARAALKGLPDPTRRAVVINRIGPGGQMTLAELRRALGCSICIELPCCAALRDVEDRVALLESPIYRYKRRVASLARTLVTA
jgi:CO dehydrogenase nickel-insertion accessory protein CooC1